MTFNGTPTASSTNITDFPKLQKKFLRFSISHLGIPLKSTPPPPLWDATLTFNSRISIHSPCIIICFSPSVVSKITRFHFIMLKYLRIFMHFQKFGNCQSDVLIALPPLIRCELIPLQYCITITSAGSRYFSTLQAARGYFLKLSFWV